MIFFEPSLLDITHSLWYICFLFIFCWKIDLNKNLVGSQIMKWIILFNQYQNWMSIMNFNHISREISFELEFKKYLCHVWCTSRQFSHNTRSSLETCTVYNTMYIELIYIELIYQFCVFSKHWFWTNFEFELNLHLLCIIFLYFLNHLTDRYIRSILID